MAHEQRTSVGVQGGQKSLAAAQAAALAHGGWQSSAPSHQNRRLSARLAKRSGRTDVARGDAIPGQTRRRGSRVP